MIMKKIIAILLTTVMLISACSGVALAVKSKTNDEPVLLFSDDFSALSEDGKVTVGSRDEQWTQVVENAETDSQ